MYQLSPQFKLYKTSILVNRGSHFQVRFVWQVWDGQLSFFKIYKILKLLEGGNATGVQQSSKLGFWGERVCRRRNQTSLSEALEAQLLSFSICIYTYIYICGNPPSRNDKIVCVLKLSHGWVQGGGHTYTHINTYQFLPVVQHKAAAEVSKIGNYRRGALLWCMDGRANPLMDRKLAVIFGVAAVVTSPTTEDVMWAQCNCSCSCSCSGSCSCSVVVVAAVVVVVVEV